MRDDVMIECSAWEYEVVALVLAILKERHKQFAPKEPSVAPQVDELSRTELRVLRYLPTSLSRPAIARELYVSVSTVSTHIRNIYSKLGASSRTEAVERARQLNLIAR